MNDGAWRYVRASVIGASHNATGLNCQDRHDVLLTTDATGGDILALVVSDGAGSAAKSEAGSELTCRMFIAIVEDYFLGGGVLAEINEDLLDTWVNKIHEALVDKAADVGCILRDLACTLLALIVGKSRAIAVQVGDGAIVVRNSGRYEVAIWPQSGQYVNSTYFVTDDDFMNNLRLVIINEEIDEAAVFTDGIQILALHYATQTVFEPFFRPMFEKLRKEPPGESSALNESLEEYLGSSLINERTDDDKTLILATRLQP